MRQEDSGVALSTPASSLAFRQPYRVQLEAQPPHALHILTAASPVCPAHVPILPLASTRCSVQSFEACAPCSAVAGWVGGAKDRGACQYARGQEKSDEVRAVSPKPSASDAKRLLRRKKPPRLYRSKHRVRASSVLRDVEAGCLSLSKQIYEP